MGQGDEAGDDRYKAGAVGEASWSTATAATTNVGPLLPLTRTCSP